MKEKLMILIVKAKKRKKRNQKKEEKKITYNLKCLKIIIKNHI